MSKERWPSKNQIEEAMKEIAKKGGTRMLPLKPTPLEKLRWDICQAFLAYKLKKKIKNIELADEICTSEAEVSRILHHQIDGISTDKLLKLLSIIKPKHYISLKVS